MTRTSHIEVRLRQRNPLKAMRYAEDGMNVEAVCRFIRDLGGEFDGFTSGNHLYIQKIRGVWDSRTEVWPGDWIVGSVKGGVVPRSHADMCRDFERVDGADFDSDPPKEPEDAAPSWIKLEDGNYRGGGLMGRRDAL